MFDEVFGGINFGTNIDKKKCPCGCTCTCFNGEEDRVSTTNSRTSIVYSAEVAVEPQLV